ncbi:2OG-Fe dioxygenase family protein [Frateuria sp. STR12]|uniref:2OG-Fe dioxygenase family protein n=1 Tax=Frateuria hangzhouensis TaxID=2995589 RepID=UPI002260FEE9|nr:2OG-Fe dioxygenase family protein [Frateuria sp. STR12]MCX7512924.1 2OG-Fe dioxygenase family protein [Frateuria sp. STR12]
MTAALPALHDQLRQDGFAFAAADTMLALLDASSLPDWQGFTASWNELAPDAHLASIGRHRRRRHAVFSAGPQGIEREPHQPHYQSKTYNNLQGDIERWFEPLAADGPSLRRVLHFCHGFFGALAPAVACWHVEVHQFRIEARADEAGEPTPEGVHRDGVDFVLVLLVDRTNIESGTTTIHAADGRLLGEFTLTRPFDAALVDDARVFHGVTAVTPFDPAQPAHRDVLVVTFRDAARARAPA